MTTLIIKKVKPSSFVGSEGDRITYFWYKALRQDGVTIDFGSKNEYKVDEEIEIDLEKTELSGGKFRYKEASF